MMPPWQYGADPKPISRLRNPHFDPVLNFDLEDPAFNFVPNDDTKDDDFNHRDLSATHFVSDDRATQLPGPVSQDAVSLYEEMRSITEQRPSNYPQQGQNQPANLSRSVSQDALPSPYPELQSIREQQPPYYPQQTQIQPASLSRSASQDALPSPYTEMRSIRENQPSSYPQQGQNLDVMSFKKSTRVETALEIRLELSNVANTWSHINKIRLHRQHVTKSKHLQDLATTPMDADTLELRATAFSSVAMKVPERRLRLLAGAGKLGEILDSESPSSLSDVIPTTAVERILAHDGEPIRMCQLCNEREKKRLQRSFNEKKKKTEGSDLWLTEASQKVVVINNKPILDCKRPSSCITNSATQLMNAISAPSPDEENDDQEDKGRKKVMKKPSLPPVKEGTIVVDISMRICCYCRHHKDPDGFQ